MNKQNIRENLLQVLNDEMQVDQAMNLILTNREVITTYKLSKPIDLNGSNRTSDYYKENDNGNESNEEALWWKTFKQSNVHRSFTSKEYPM